MARIRRGNNYKTTHLRREARRREVSSADLYRYNPYESPYKSTLHGRSPNRRMNNRSMGVCGSCSSRKRSGR